jgi:hypothetical protein
VCSTLRLGYCLYITSYCMQGSVVTFLQEELWMEPRGVEVNNKIIFFCSTCLDTKSISLKFCLQMLASEGDKIKFMRRFIFDRNKLECLPLSVTSTLVLYFRARLGAYTLNWSPEGAPLG